MTPSAAQAGQPMRRSVHMVSIIAVILSVVLAHPADAQRGSRATADRSRSAPDGTPSAGEGQLAPDRDRLELEKQKLAVETKREIDKLETEIIALILSADSARPGEASRGSHSNGRRSARQAASGTPSTEERRLALDRDRLEFEKQKFAVETKRENDKLQNERTQQYWSSASAIVPIIAALLTLVYGIMSLRETAKLQFFIKAAEIAFAGKTPEAVENRSKLLKKIFGTRLPDNFPPQFDPGEHGGGKEPPEGKVPFVEMLLKYPGQDQKILGLWTELFGDAWLKRVKPLLTDRPGREIEPEKPAPNDTGIKAGPANTPVEPGVGDGNEAT
jgi:hypothetical protein